MQCPKCNARINKTSIYCNNCGVKLKDTSSKDVKEEKKQPVKEKENITLEIIDTYIGVGKEDLKKKNFSFLAFLFGSLYYYYRKLYLEATIFLIFDIIIFFLGGTKILILNLLLRLYAGFTFKRHYMKHVEEQAINIINYNISGKKEDALLKAYNEGGTTTVPIIIISCLYLFSIFSLFVYVIVTDDILTSTETDDTEITEDYPEIEELTFEVPSGFIEDKRSTDTYKLYSTKDKYCNFYISERYLGGYDPNRHNYGHGSIDHLKVTKEPEEILINGYNWKFESETTKTSNTYNLSYTGDYIQYNLSFFYITDESHAYCEESYEELKNSLELN